MRRENGGMHSIALRRLITGIAASNFGDGLVYVAFPLLALRLTSRPLLIAAVSIAASLPWLVISLPAGAVADRFDRRRLVWWVDITRALVIGALGFAIATHHCSMILVLIVAFAVGAGETVVTAATKAVLPLLAEGDQLMQANGRVNAAETAGAAFAGPALGGVLFSLTASLPFIGDGLTYLMSAFLFRAAIPVRPHSRSRGEVSLVADVRSGLRLFLGNRSLLVLAAAVSTFAFCQAMVFSVVVLYATRVLHLHEIGFGLLLCVAAIGNIASSLMASRVRNALGSVGTVIGAGIVAAGGYLLLGGTRNVVLAGLALTLESTGTGVGNVATFSLRQALIPVERFGLVNNAFRTCLSGIVPLGALIGGALTTSFGTRTTFFVAGTFQLVALALMAFPLRGVPARQVEP